jgi:hypothetical protein
MGFLPKDETPWTDQTGPAEDAVASLVYALECRLNGSSEYALMAARRVRDAIDSHLTNRDKLDLNLPNVEERLQADPLLEAEGSRQCRDIEELLGGTVTMAVLRDRAKAEAASVFG